MLSSVVKFSRAAKSLPSSPDTAFAIRYTQRIMPHYGKKKHPARTGRSDAPRAAAVAAPDPESEARRGLAAFERGDYGEAIQSWGRARSARPSPALDRALAEAHFRRGLSANPIRRVPELQEAVALVPDRAVYHYHLGLAYHRQGQFRRALAAHDEAHRLAPDDERISCQLALIHLIDLASAERARDLLDRGPAASERAARLQAIADLRASDSSAAVAGLAGRKSPSPLAILTLALAHLTAGHLDETRTALARVKRSRQPLGSEARQLVTIATALVHLRSGELDQAQKALASQPVPADSGLRKAYASASRKLAVELLLADRLEESIATWGRVREAVPTDEAVHHCQLHLLEVGGMQAVERGEFATAIKLWQAALVDQPNHGWLLRNLALAEERLERWSSARDHWERLTRQWKKELTASRNNEAAAALRPRLEAAYRHLAGTGEAAGDLHAAANAMERALGLDPSDVDLRLRAAELYLANEDASRAIEHLRRVLVARPNDARIYLDLGSAFDLKRDDRQAQTNLERALSIEPTNAAIQSTLASVHHGRAHRLDESGLGERAIAEYERAIVLAPADPTHPQCLGDLRLKLGQPDEATLAYGRALALRPGDARMRVEIGGRYLARGFEAEAERLFREALRLDRGLAMPAAIGIAYLSHQNKAKAEAYFKRVLKGKDLDLLALVASAFMTAGSLDEAIPYLERAVALDSRDVDARLSLAYAYAFGRHDHDRATSEIDEAERLATVQGDLPLLADIAVARDQNNAVRELELRGRRSPPVKGG